MALTNQRYPTLRDNQIRVVVTTSRGAGLEKIDSSGSCGTKFIFYLGGTAVVSTCHFSRMLPPPPKHDPFMYPWVKEPLPVAPWLLPPVSVGESGKELSPQAVIIIKIPLLYASPSTPTTAGECTFYNQGFDQQGIPPTVGTI